MKSDTDIIYVDGLVNHSEFLSMMPYVLQAHNSMKHVVESNEALVRQTWQYLAKCVGMKEVLPLVGMTQRRNFAPKDSCIYFKPSPNGTENGIKQKNNGKVTQEYEKL